MISLKAVSLNLAEVPSEEPTLKPPLVPFISSSSHDRGQMLFMDTDGHRPKESPKLLVIHGPQTTMSCVLQFPFYCGQKNLLLIEQLNKYNSKKLV